ncbi:NAD(P)/FAD-dependent oxidoreductase [bacterium]|nr:NAD(P)/FAD-dependent oxidoreductase [bacterium]
MKKKTAIIIGAGPAGLTAALELLRQTDIKPIIFEQSDALGGISKTVNYKGNRLDLGGHRFFSKSDRIMKWWQDILPLQGQPARDDRLLGRSLPLSTETDAPDPEREDRVMLIRQRLSRIFYLRRFFDYPISLSLKTLRNLGLLRIIKIGFSYTLARLFPIKSEKSLEDFFINRFGRELYLTFFKDYTEKVWGLPCNEIAPEWGAQRVKGLSILNALTHALKTLVNRDSTLEQKQTQTSLIEQFMYPKYGPGQLWEEVARLIIDRGGEIHYNQRVVGLGQNDHQLDSVTVLDCINNSIRTFPADYVFSTMPVRDLVPALGDTVTPEVKEVAEGLCYRDFLIVGLLLNKLNIANTTSRKTINQLIPDNWIYIQERDVTAGRLQIFNNWSPYMVHDPDKVWIGVEYFCYQNDAFWSKNDQDISAFAIAELTQIDLINPDDVLDSVVVRMEKTYPAYFGSYDRFDCIRQHLDPIPNLFLIGRNGMHRYNNQDHSMLTAITAVENIVRNISTKDNIWSINTEEEYHELKT